MQNVISQTTKKKTDNTQTIVPLESLLAELDYCRRRASKLSTMNELHRRLAGATDLPGMVEALSVWLTPFVEHDLIGYNNPELKRSYMYCSCHGPQRKEILNLTEKQFGSVVSENWEGSWEEDGYHIHIQHIDSVCGRGQLILLSRQHQIGEEGERIIGEALDILGEPLRRALDYEELYEQASRDALTGLPNRRVFESRITDLLEHTRRHNHPITMASIDLDRFKQINDTMGHLKGDEVLQTVAATFSATVRKSDLLVRMGGDEFLLVLPETDLPAAHRLAERLCQAVTDLDICTSKGTRLGVSIGLAQWEPQMTLDQWLQRADEVLYHAKATGRSRVCTA